MGPKVLAGVGCACFGLSSAVLLLFVRAALWPLPFEVLLRGTGRIGQPARPGHNADLSIVWAVRRASSRFPVRHA